MAAPLRKKVKITDVKFMVVLGTADWNMVKLETDSGLAGIGEAYWGHGVKDIVLGNLRDLVIGEDPLDVERLYSKMIRYTGGMGSIAGVTVTAISGIEIALWDLAELYSIPVCAHNVCSPLGTLASAHCAAAIAGFRAHEFVIGRMPSTKEWEEFVIHEGPIIKDGKIQIQDKLGFGVELNEDYVRAHLAPGETWWG